ncbi:hypothetical protein FRC00_004361 [Tulasnella sp. 408]|nr:hypothetical protein FRC00_004361 [Tulasnella sp. 408]
MSEEYARFMSDGQDSELLAFSFAAPTANRSTANEPTVDEPKVILLSSSRNFDAPSALRPSNSSSTAKRVSTVPKAPQPQNAAALDTVWNRDSEGSRQPRAPSSSTDGQSPGPSQFNTVRWCIGL